MQMSMKTTQIILVVGLFLMSLQLKAQHRAKNLTTYDLKPLHFGFTVGYNQLGFSMQHSDIFMQLGAMSDVYSIETKSNPGFHLGPVSNFRISEYLDARILINFTFSQRDLTYITFLENADGTREYDFHTMNIATTSLDFPVLLKFRSKRIHNYRPYLIAGASPLIDLAARKEIDPAEMPKIKITPFDFHLQSGAGIDFYLPYFKLSAEFKFSMGIKNLIVDDNTQYSEAFKTLRSHMYMFSLHFE